MRLGIVMESFFALMRFLTPGPVPGPWAAVEDLVAAAASIAIGLVVGLYCHPRIRGYTGDTLGATNELVECVPALVGDLWT